MPVELEIGCPRDAFPSRIAGQTDQRAVGMAPMGYAVIPCILIGDELAFRLTDTICSHTAKRIARRCGVNCGHRPFVAVSVPEACRMLLSAGASPSRIYPSVEGRIA